MKALLVLLLLTGAALAPAADTAPLNGKWQIYIRIADREASATCTFVQTGNDLAGECTSDRGTEKVTGKVEDTKVTWKSTGGTVTLSYTGTLGKTADMAGFVAGSVLVEEYGVEGEFTATQAK
jgi:hypothetical protein